MTENKTTVERYLEGFERSNHEQILSCLTEGVEWEMPGAFHLVGKDAFDKEIEIAVRRERGPRGTAVEVASGSGIDQGANDDAQPERRGRSGHHRDVFLPDQ